MEWESSRYDLQNMSWEEAAAIWVPELGMSLGNVAAH
jgi:hypothetical protein